MKKITKKIPYFLFILMTSLVVLVSLTSCQDAPDDNNDKVVDDSSQSQDDDNKQESRYNKLSYDKLLEPQGNYIVFVYSSKSVDDLKLLTKTKKEVTLQEVTYPFYVLDINETSNVDIMTDTDVDLTTVETYSDVKVTTTPAILCITEDKQVSAIYDPAFIALHIDPDNFELILPGDGETEGENNGTGTQNPDDNQDSRSWENYYNFRINDFNTLLTRSDEPYMVYFYDSTVSENELKETVLDYLDAWKYPNIELFLVNTNEMKEVFTVIDKTNALSLIQNNKMIDCFYEIEDIKNKLTNISTVKVTFSIEDEPLDIEFTYFNGTRLNLRELVLTVSELPADEIEKVLANNVEVTKSSTTLTSDTTVNIIRKPEILLLVHIDGILTHTFTTIKGKAINFEEMFNEINSLNLSEYQTVTYFDRTTSKQAEFCYDNIAFNCDTNIYITSKIESDGSSTGSNLSGGNSGSESENSGSSTGSSSSESTGSSSSTTTPEKPTPERSEMFYEVADSLNNTLNAFSSKMTQTSGRGTTNEKPCSGTWVSSYTYSINHEQFTLSFDVVTTDSAYTSNQARDNVVTPYTLVLHGEGTSNLIVKNLVFVWKDGTRTVKTKTSSSSASGLFLEDTTFKRTLIDGTTNFSTSATINYTISVQEGNFVMVLDTNMTLTEKSLVASTAIRIDYCFENTEVIEYYTIGINLYDSVRLTNTINTGEWYQLYNFEYTYKKED